MDQKQISYKQFVEAWRKEVGVDKIVNIMGKVKAHKDYNGKKQTVLTRCKVLAVAESGTHSTVGVGELE